MAIIGLNKLCTPALFYFILSVVAIAIMAFQNIGNNGIYCVGSYSCNTGSVVAIFMLKIVYVLFWTWLLNIICKSGYETLSWFLVLLPFILLFILIGILFFTQIDPARHATLNIWSI